MAPAKENAPVPSELWTADDIPAPRLLDVLTQIAHFFDQIGYKKTLSALTKEASSKNDLTLDIAAWTEQIEAKNAAPLLSLHEEWHEGNDKFPTLQAPAIADDSDDSSSNQDSDSEKDEAEGVLVDVEAEETSDDDSDEKDESAGDSSDSSSSEEEKEAPTNAGAKRKRAVSPPSSSDDSSDASSSDSDSDKASSSSSESEAPPAKKARKSSPAKSTKVKKTKASKKKASSSDSDSSSSASSDSSDSSSSESEEEKPAPPPVKKDGKEKKENKGKEAKPAKDNSSASSATLEAESSPEKEEAPVSHVHPDRLRQVPGQAPKPTTKKEIAAQTKKQQMPFSRIPADQKVDEKFASNEYVSYDYADRAHRDLIVTRGKGFTKEKNKKKRGSYRGGTIDLTPKGIKFDD